MSMPKSVVKINKNGIQYTSSVDRVSYNIYELSRRAMYDVGKVLARKTKHALGKQRGMSNHYRITGKKGMGKSDFEKRPPAVLYKVPFVKDGLPHLNIGITHNTWYGVEQELGSSRVPKKGALSRTVQSNIPLIIEIESRYLSALENEAETLRLISEDEYIGGGDD